MKTMEKMIATSTTAYALFIDSMCEGPVPVEFDADNKPVLYPTLEAAQRVIAEDLAERLRQFLAGEGRDYEDAINPEEYPCLVTVLSDGSVQPID